MLTIYLLSQMLTIYPPDANNLSPFSDAASFTITPLQSTVTERAGSFVPLGVTITDASPSLDQITWQFSKVFPPLLGFPLYHSL